MPCSPTDLFAYLDRLGIVHTTVCHAPVFSVAESRALRGRIPGAHTKNLFLKAKSGELYLIVALEDARIDLKRLHQRFGIGRFSFGSPELMREVLGVEPGSVTPFALMNDTDHRVTAVLEAAMMQHEVLNYHPLDNARTTSIARDDLVRFLGATGHPPQVLTLAEPHVPG